MAYNEEANIGRLLQTLLDQRTSVCVIKEIIVLCSGCTDGTETIVRRFCTRDPRIRLVSQSCREGKASAVNLFLHHAQSDILISVGADTLPEIDAIERLVEPLGDPEVGMTGAHPVPVNDPGTFMGFAAHLLWEMHHQVALNHPKLGEMTAYRRIFQRIPRDSAVDEANMEPLIRGQGYKLCYVPEAIVRNRGPQTVADFLKQRRRIYAGHLRMHREQGYVVSTMGGDTLVQALVRSWRLTGRHPIWTAGVIGLEFYGRVLGWIDFRLKKHDHAVWDMATTTKGAIE
jgi:cellulose synthase/poly-beta-1,6-N-acetylglucosamine synthase-like glycosyltransferase